MTETQKTVRRFILTVIWTLFVTLTLTGLTVAGERTEFVRSGKEAETVKIDYNKIIAAIVG